MAPLKNTVGTLIFWCWPKFCFKIRPDIFFAFFFCFRANETIFADLQSANFACFEVNLIFLDHADKIHTKPQYAILALVENYVTGMS